MKCTKWYLSRDQIIARTSSHCGHWGDDKDKTNGNFRKKIYVLFTLRSSGRRGGDRQEMLDNDDSIHRCLDRTIINEQFSAQKTITSSSLIENFQLDGAVNVFSSGKYRSYDNGRTLVAVLERGAMLFVAREGDQLERMSRVGKVTMQHDRSTVNLSWL